MSGYFFFLRATKPKNGSDMSGTFPTEQSSPNSLNDVNASNTVESQKPLDELETNNLASVNPHSTDKNGNKHQSTMDQAQHHPFAPSAGRVWKTFNSPKNQTNTPSDIAQSSSPSLPSFDTVSPPELSSTYITPLTDDKLIEMARKLETFNKNITARTMGELSHMLDMLLIHDVSNWSLKSTGILHRLTLFRRDFDRLLRAHRNTVILQRMDSVIRRFNEQINDARKPSIQPSVDPDKAFPATDGQNLDNKQPARNQGGFCFTKPEDSSKTSLPSFHSQDGSSQLPASTANTPEAQSQSQSFKASGEGGFVPRYFPPFSATATPPLKDGGFVPLLASSNQQPKNLFGVVPSGSQPPPPPPQGNTPLFGTVPFGSQPPPPPPPPPPQGNTPLFGPPYAFLKNIQEPPKDNPFISKDPQPFANPFSPPAKFNFGQADHPPSTQLGFNEAGVARIDDDPKPVASPEMPDPDWKKELDKQKAFIDDLNTTIFNLEKEKLLVAKALSKATDEIDESNSMKDKLGKHILELKDEHRKKWNSMIRKKDAEKDSGIRELKLKYEEQIEDADSKLKLHKDSQASLQQLAEQVHRLENNIIDIELAKATVEKKCQDLMAKVTELEGFETGYAQIQHQYEELQMAYNDLVAECEGLKEKTRALEEVTKSSSGDNPSERTGPSSSLDERSQVTARIASTDHLNGLMYQWENQLRLKEQSLDQKRTEITQTESAIAKLRPTGPTSEQAPSSPAKGPDSAAIGPPSDKNALTVPKQSFKATVPAHDASAVAVQRPSSAPPYAPPRTFATVAGSGLPSQDRRHIFNQDEEWPVVGQHGKRKNNNARVRATRNPSASHRAAADN